MVLKKAKEKKVKVTFDIEKLKNEMEKFNTSQNEFMFECPKNTLSSDLTNNTTQLKNALLKLQSKYKKMYIVSDLFTRARTSGIAYGKGGIRIAKVILEKAGYKEKDLFDLSFEDEKIILTKQGKKE